MFASCQNCCQPLAFMAHPPKPRLNRPQPASLGSPEVGQPPKRSLRKRSKKHAKSPTTDSSKTMKCTQDSLIGTLSSRVQFRFSSPTHLRHLSQQTQSAPTLESQVFSVKSMSTLPNLTPLPPRSPNSSKTAEATRTTFTSATDAVSPFMARQLTPPAHISKRWSSPSPLPQEPKENGSSLAPGEGSSHFEISLMNSKIVSREGDKSSEGDNLLQVPQGRIAVKSVVSRGDIEECMGDSLIIDTPLRDKNQLTSLM